jgi:hypothetical protein
MEQSVIHASLSLVRTINPDRTCYLSCGSTQMAQLDRPERLQIMLDAGELAALDDWHL